MYYAIANKQGKFLYTKGFTKKWVDDIDKATHWELAPDYLLDHLNRDAMWIVEVK